MRKPVKRGRGRPRNERPKRKVIIYVEPDLMDDVIETAKKLGQSRSEYVSMIIKRSVQRRRKDEIRLGKEESPIL